MPAIAHLPIVVLDVALGEPDLPALPPELRALGRVRPCFFQPPLGNVRAAKSLEAVLNGPDALAWRQGLDTHWDAMGRACVCSLQLRAADEAMPAV